MNTPDSFGEFRRSLRRGLGHGAGFGAGLALILLSTALVADLPYEFTAGELVSASQINANFQQLGDETRNNNDRIDTLVGQVGTLETTETNHYNTTLTTFTTVNTAISDVQNNMIPPIGTIMAWQNHISGTPGLPENWVPCDGRTIAVAGSPMNGHAVPNLNDAPGGDYSAGYFLRGATSSGSTETDAFQGHRHWRRPDRGAEHNTAAATNDGPAVLPGGPHHGVNQVDTGSPKDDGQGTPRIARETRPVNFRVIWIIRIK